VSKLDKYPLVLPALRTLDQSACSEFRFHGERKWRADFAIPSRMILIEIEGGIWSGGRHTRGGGFAGDMEKYNAAAVLGYRLLRYTPSQCRAKQITRIINDVRDAIK